MSSFAHNIDMSGEELDLPVDAYDDYFYNSVLELSLQPQQDEYEHAWDFSLSECSSPSRCQSSSNSIASEAIITTFNSDTPAVQGPSPPSERPKRKRPNRYKNAPPELISRRRAQNRASQRAFRERKEQRIHELEQLLDEAHRKERILRQAFVAIQPGYSQPKAQHNTGGPSSQTDTSAFSSATAPEGDAFFTQPIFTGVTMEDTSAIDRMFRAILPREPASEADFASYNY